MSSAVLVVEDDREIRDLLRRYLERAGYQVHTAGTGGEAIRVLDAGAGTQLIVLDLGLPDLDGLEVLRAARTDSDAGRVPVVVLTARGEVDDRIRGLRAGADDYVTKPFSPTELVLRVQAVLARAGCATAEDSASFGQGRLVLDQPARQATVDGTPVELTPTEWGLLTTLAGTPGRVFSRYELVNRVRGYEFAGYERTIDSHIKNLRRKLGPDSADMVETVLGAGYRLGWRRDG